MQDVIPVAESAGSRNALSLDCRASRYSVRLVERPLWADLMQHIAGQRDVYTFRLYAWTNAIRWQSSLELSCALRTLARQAWARIDANRNVDVDVWARRIAADVAGAKD